MSSWLKIAGDGYRYLVPGERVRYEAEIGKLGKPDALRWNLRRSG